MSDADPQGEVFRLLSLPETYGPGIAAVERIDTHISAVFLAGDRAWKLKRAVRLPFVDFSTLVLRRAACLAEVEINRRTAPAIYRGVVPVVRRSDGSLALGGAGEAVDWVVEMTRFPQEALFDRIAAAGGLTREHALALADEVAAFHDAAEARPDHGGEAGLRAGIDANTGGLSVATPAVFDPIAAARATEGALASLTRLTPLLEERRLGGFVRHCHGDLHLRNICLYGGRPTLFDAIEFNDDFACIDTLFDLAFLLMDLRHRGLGETASWVFNRYLDRRGDYAGLAALPLFLSVRAATRAHVTAAVMRVSGETRRREEAISYLDAAQDYLQTPPARLFAVGGLSGAGKSNLARRLAPLIGAAPGAVVVRTDVLRKRLLGVAPEARLPVSAYGAGMTERTYAALCEAAAAVLAAGYTVIADAVFARPDERAAIAAAAQRTGAPFSGLWLEARPEVMRERIATRRHNASDATVDVLEKQLAYDLGPIDWMRLDSSGLHEETLVAACERLGIPPK